MPGAPPGILEMGWGAHSRTVAHRWRKADPPARGALKQFYAETCKHSLGTSLRKSQEKLQGRAWREGDAAWTEFVSKCYSKGDMTTLTSAMYQLTREKYSWRYTRTPARMASQWREGMVDFAFRCWLKVEPSADPSVSGTNLWRLSGPSINNWLESAMVARDFRAMDTITTFMVDNKKEADGQLWLKTKLNSHVRRTVKHMLKEKTRRDMLRRVRGFAVEPVCPLPSAPPVEAPAPRAKTRKKRSARTKKTRAPVPCTTT